MTPAENPPEVDRAALERALDGHPIRTAVWFGSTLGGTPTPRSDVDLAVEFEPDLSTEARHRVRLELIVDLMAALGTEDIDVADLSSVRPAVGASALRTGTILVGDPQRVEQLRERFEAEATARSHEDRMRAFDELLDRMEQTV